MNRITNKGGKWELPGNVFGFSDEEISYYLEIIRSTAHLIMEFSKGRGFENASGF